MCVRYFVACSLSLRDHETVHRWVIHFSPLLLERLNRSKRAVTSKCHVDETYIKVRGRWMYQYCDRQRRRYGRILAQ